MASFYKFDYKNFISFLGMLCALCSSTAYGASTPYHDVSEGGMIFKEAIEYKPFNVTTVEPQITNLQVAACAASIFAGFSFNNLYQTQTDYSVVVRTNGGTKFAASCYNTQNGGAMYSDDLKETLKECGQSASLMGSVGIWHCGIGYTSSSREPQVTLDDFGSCTPTSTAVVDKGDDGNQSPPGHRKRLEGVDCRLDNAALITSCQNCATSCSGDIGGPVNFPNGDCCIEQENCNICRESCFCDF